MKKRLTALVTAFAVLLGLSACAQKPGKEPEPERVEKTPVDYSVVLTSYPEQVQFPNAAEFQDDSDGFNAQWEQWRKEERDRSSLAVDAQEMEDYLTACIPELLTGTQGNEVCSPVNIYMALAMLAEVTEGDSRGQLLELLGARSMEEVRELVDRVWRSVYRDDGAVTCIPAGSVWMDQDVEYIRQTLETLARDYYASSFAGEMGSAQMNSQLQKWLNDQTGGLLQEQAAQEEFSSDTVFAIATAIYFRAKWSREFSPERTIEGDFNLLSSDGETVPCEFMRSSGTGTYYWGDNFSAVSRELENGGRMWFLLPDSDVSVSELLDDPAAVEFLLADGEWEDSKFLTVHLSVPKFDVAGKMDLSDSLKQLGVHDVFEPAVSDFTPLTAQMEGLSVSRISHAARVAVDEEGVIAAAYTVIPEAGAAMPPEEEVDFVLDRPFLFAVTAKGGLPLFMGVVQNPMFRQK